MATRADLPLRGYQVPKISELLAKLKYDPQRNKVNEDGKNALDSLVSEFRVSFQTSDGIRGAELDFWSIPEHREGLKEMAAQFLAQSGHRLWPSDENEEYYEPDLIWTRDEEVLVTFSVVVID
jgi:hypothetical protein